MKNMPSYGTLKTCIECGQPFSGNGVMCGRRCQGIAQIKQFSEPKTCSVCDKPFTEGFRFYHKGIHSKGCFLKRCRELNYPDKKIEKFMDKIERDKIE